MLPTVGIDTHMKPRVEHNGLGVGNRCRSVLKGGDTTFDHRPWLPARALDAPVVSDDELRHIPRIRNGHDVSLRSQH